MRNSSRLALALALMACFGCSGNHPRVLPHDAYIWQRRWTPALVDALRQSTDVVRAWRVLLAESDARGHLRPIGPNWKVLDATALPIVVVIRIDDRMADSDQSAILGDIRSVFTHAIPRDAKVTGLEIDYDCATAQLGAYAEFLARLRPELARDLTLSITILPTWMSSPQLGDLLAQTDESVLQVHAVRNPHSGLFDPTLALEWIRAFARLSPRPFRAALPAYGSRISWRTDGTVLAVEGEVPLLAGGFQYSELIAQPRAVAQVLEALQRDPPSDLLGVAWFRLPTANDARAWSISTWRAVLRGTDVRADVEVLVQKTQIPGMNNLVLVNEGAIDANLPRAVMLPTMCTLADAINGYTIARDGMGLLFERQEAGLLRSHYQQTIGWMRCSPEQGNIHVAP